MSNPTQYVSKKDVAASYRPKSYVSLLPGLIPSVRISQSSVLPFACTALSDGSPPLALKCTILHAVQQMSPGLLRARAPFKVRNALTGVTIAVLVVGVWAYSIAAVKQDSFADVDEEAKILAASGSTQNIKSIEDEEKAKAGTIATLVHTPSTTIGITAPAVTPLPGLAPRPRGVLAPLMERYYPRLLDPTNGTIVWGAPPVDRIGRLRRD